MLIAVVLAGGILSGLHPGVIAVAALAAFHPLWFLGAAGGWALVTRVQRARLTRPEPGDEVAFLHAVASELRSGGSLRTSIDAARARAPRLPLDDAARKAVSGLPADQVAESLARALPVNGRLAGAAFALSSTTGARSADVFESLAGRAAEAGELARERRALTAQARLSAAVVGLGPIGFAGLLLATGRAGTLLESGFAGVIVAASGLALEVAGLVVVWSMLRRAER